MSLLADISFMEVALALVTLAVVEHLMVRYLPETLVGPNGLLLIRDED